MLVAYIHHRISSHGNRKFRRIILDAKIHAACQGHIRSISLIMPVVTAGRVLSLILIPFNAHVYLVMSGVLFCSIERCETHSVRVLLIRCVMILMASQASGSTAWLLWLGIPKCRTRAFGIRNQQELIWIFWWIFTCLSIFIMATDAHTAHMHYTLCV